MKTGIHSDFHISDGSEADNFKEVESKFIALRDRIQRECDLEICNGDITDDNQAKGRTREQRWRNICAAHPKVVADLKFSLAWKIGGNHDPERWPHKSYLYLDPASRIIIHAHHGHKFDIWNSRFKIVGFLCTRIAGWLERRGWEKAEVVLSKFAKRVTGSNPAADQFRYIEGMKGEVDRLAKRYPGYKVIEVIGHTHILKAVRYGEHVLVQTGKCSAGVVQWVKIDTQAGTIALYGLKKPPETTQI